MKRILLYGEMGQKFGKDWALDVATPAEALRAIGANRPDFRSYLFEAQQAGIRFKVYCGKDRLIEAPSFDRPFSVNETIRIAPVMVGAGGNGLIPLALGVTLIVASGGTGVLAGGALGLSGATIGAIGVGLALTGVSALLSPKPAGQSSAAQRQTNPNNLPSFGFSGPVNVTLQGGCVPVAYGGPIIVGSQVISAGMFAEDI